MLVAKSETQAILATCPGGWCDWCPVKIQLECEMTTEDRIEHIRQCLRRMKPTMGFELAAAAEIEKELVALATFSAAATAAIEELFVEINRLNKIVSIALSGDTCG